MKYGTVKMSEIARHPTHRMDPEYWLTPPCKVGDRIRLTAPVKDDYPPEGLPAGLEGTVDHIGQWASELTRQIGVRWDNGRRLMLLPGDEFEVLEWTDPTELDGLP
jgi:hypothetical protein